MRSAGVQGRTEAQLAARTTTPDFIVDAGLATRGIRWVDVKHSVGRQDVSKLQAQAREPAIARRPPAATVQNRSMRAHSQVARYVTDWGPGALIFTLGYTEAFADELRATSPVWVLDPLAGERVLSGGPLSDGSI